MPAKKIVFIKDNEEYKLDCLPKTDVYKLCELLDQGGAQSIRTYTVYETLDDLYVQGRSTRNFSDIPHTQRQLELF